MLGTPSLYESAQSARLVIDALVHDGVERIRQGEADEGTLRHAELDDVATVDG